jgi:hypothetical protein
MVHRAIQTVAPDKWEQKIEIERRFHAVEERLGWAAARHYRCRIGADSRYTYVKEWEFKDWATRQDLSEKARAHPAQAELQALRAEDREKGITIDQRDEVYELLDV